jgi:hypothetical protein
MTTKQEGISFNKLIPHLNKEFKKNVSSSSTSLCDVFVLSENSEKHFKDLIIKNVKQEEKVSNL